MILIAYGANLPSQIGAPAETIRAALSRLSHNGVTPVAVSSFYTTPAWPNPSDPSYVNAVALMRTELTPVLLMKQLQETESAFGRMQTARNAPRTLDLDILDYDGKVEAGPPQLPHPRLESRAFVLVPLRDVAPDWRHPVSGKGIDELIAALPVAEREAVRPLA